MAGQLSEKGTFTGNYHEYKKTVLAYAATVAIAAAAQFPKPTDLSLAGFKLSTEAMTLVVSGLCVATLYYVAQFTLRWRDEGVVELPLGSGEVQSRVDILENNQRALTLSINTMSRQCEALKLLSETPQPEMSAMPHSSYFKDWLTRELAELSRGDDLQDQFRQANSIADRWRFPEGIVPEEEQKERDAAFAAQIEEYFQNTIPAAITKAAEKSVGNFEQDLNQKSNELLGLYMQMQAGSFATYKLLKKAWKEELAQIKRAASETEKLGKKLFDVKVTRHRETVADIIVVYVVSISSLCFWSVVSGFFPWAFGKYLVVSLALSIAFSIAFWFFAWSGGPRLSRLADDLA
ncbi:hypothetical protein [Caulobacter sp. Root1472]|uniref:hypothetical protein n=1 Tax=Caulobacter sp. Root1472 TaxID=1736470 RepID=UPI000ABBC2E2|nr:hypothetical protein [Caulobacter sp. Root1472]